MRLQDIGSKFCDLVPADFQNARVTFLPFSYFTNGQISLGIEGFGYMIKDLVNNEQRHRNDPIRSWEYLQNVKRDVKLASYETLES